jgi:hypothetical protein
MDIEKALSKLKVYSAKDGDNIIEMSNSGNSVMLLSGTKINLLSGEISTSEK